MNPLKLIADSPATYEALKELLDDLFQVDREEVIGLNNEQIGEVVRASLTGLYKVDLAFREIDKHKTIERVQNNINPAR